MRGPLWLQQFDLFNAAANQAVSLPPTLRTEVVRLLCALLLEVMPPQQSQPIPPKEEQS